MELVVSPDTLVKQLKTLGKLPKIFQVNVKNGGHKYALVRIRQGDHSVIIAYEVARKLLERLKGKQVTAQFRTDGIVLAYNHGKAFLKHLGDWDDVPTVQLIA